MLKLASKVCLSLFIVLSLLTNYSISAKPFETENKSNSLEYSLPVLPNPDSPTTEVEALAETPPNPDFETKSYADEPTDDLQIINGDENNLSQELASPPSVNIDENISISLSPSNADNSVLDTLDMDNLSQEKPDPSAIEIKENPFLPPSPSVDFPAVGTKEDENVSQENLSSDLSFTQENRSPFTYVNAPAPETKGEQDLFTTQDYSSATDPPYTESQNPENYVTQLNDYSSLHKTAVPAPLEELSFPESDPIIQMTPSNDDMFGLAPTSQQHTILPFKFNYRAEDVWNGVNGAVAGILIGACVIAVGGLVYQKRKKDTIRPQYQCLANKGRV